eukprot:713114-Prymnesium_polylepis.1
MRTQSSDVPASCPARRPRAAALHRALPTSYRECQCDDFYRQSVLDCETSDFYHFKFNLPNLYPEPPPPSSVADSDYHRC